MQQFQHKAGFITIDDWKLYFQEPNSKKKLNQLPAVGGFLPAYLIGVLMVASFVLFLAYFVVLDPVDHYSELGWDRISLIAFILVAFLVVRWNMIRARAEFEEFHIRIINISRILLLQNGQVIIQLKLKQDGLKSVQELEFDSEEFDRFKEWLMRSKLSSVVANVWTPTYLEASDETPLLNVKGKRGIMALSTKTLWISNYGNKKPLIEWSPEDDKVKGRKVESTQRMLSVIRFILLIGLLVILFPRLLPGLLTDLGLDRFEKVLEENMLLVGIAFFGLSLVDFSSKKRVSFQTDIQNLLYIYMDEKSLVWKIGVNSSGELLEFDFSFSNQSARMEFIEFLVKSSNSDYVSRLKSSSYPTQSSHLASE